MTQQHSFTPSPELIKDWHDEWNESDQIVHSAYTHIAIRAAQWGADQELEACLGEVSFLNSQALADRVRAARRPKPPSLKEQALEALAHILNNSSTQLGADTIRRALEKLPDNE